jgi:deoxyribonuclease-4
MILGHHIRTDGKFYTSAGERAVETGADVYQIFYRPNLSYKEFKRNSTDSLKLAKSNKDNKKKMVIHGSYLINLCQNEDDYRHSKGVDILVDDLNQSVKLNAMGVIIHMGNDTKNLLGHAKCKENYILGIKRALKESDSKSILILETGAKTGSEVSSSIKELGEIRKGLESNEKSRLKFCLDTCHMFACGYKLNDPLYCDMLEMDIENQLGWDNIAVIHLNDSEDPCGSHKDNHADIGKGKIGFEGLMKFVSICVKHTVPMILETPTHFYNGKRFTHDEQMKLIRTYYNLMYKDFGPMVEIKDRSTQKKQIKQLMKKQKIKNDHNINDSDNDDNSDINTDNDIEEDN